MTIDWEESNGTNWREEYKLLKGSLSIAEISLLEKGAKTMKEAWHLGALHAEYKRLKKNKPPELPILNEEKQLEINNQSVKSK